MIDITYRSESATTMDNRLRRAFQVAREMAGGCDKLALSGTAADGPHPPGVLFLEEVQRAVAAHGCTAEVSRDGWLTIELAPENR